MFSIGVDSRAALSYATGVDTYKRIVRRRGCSKLSFNSQGRPRPIEGSSVFIVAVFIRYIQQLISLCCFDTILAKLLLSTVVSRSVVCTSVPGESWAEKYPSTSVVFLYISFQAGCRSDVIGCMRFRGAPPFGF